MSQIPALVVAPGVKPCLREQLFVEPLPPRTLEEGLVWNTECLLREDVPEDGVLAVGVERFLVIYFSMVQSVWEEQGCSH